MCWWFLCWWVHLPGGTLVFTVSTYSSSGPWVSCGAFCDSHSPRCMWFQVPPRRCELSLVLWIWARCPTHLCGRARWVDRWRGDWSCCCRRIPQSAPKCLFLFEKFVLLNPAATYKERPVLSHSPPLQLDHLLSGSGPQTAQLSTLPSQLPLSLWVYHFVLIPLPET